MLMSPALLVRINRVVRFEREQLAACRNDLTHGGHYFRHAAGVLAPNIAIAHNLETIEIDGLVKVADLVSPCRRIGEDLSGQGRSSGFDLLQLAIDLPQTRRVVVDLRVVIARRRLDV